MLSKHTNRMKNLPTENKLLTDLITIIETGKQQTVVQINSALTLVFWQVGKPFVFSQKQIVVPVSRQLSWSHKRRYITKETSQIRQAGN